MPYIKKDTQLSVFYKNGDGSAEPKNGLNERNVSLLTDCSASETFFDEVKALHCFQRKQAALVDKLQINLRLTRLHYFCDDGNIRANESRG